VDVVEVDGEAAAAPPDFSTAIGAAPDFSTIQAMEFQKYFSHHDTAYALYLGCTYTQFMILAD